jgi:hypothetical protein
LSIIKSNPKIDIEEDNSPQTPLPRREEIKGRGIKR